MHMPQATEPATPQAAGVSQDIARFTKKRSKKKLLLIGAAAVLALLIAVSLLQSGGSALPVSTVTLARGELINRINTSGTVESAELTRVYSTLTGRVKAVHVRAGDRVEAGDILAELDTADLEHAILIKETSMSLAARQAALSLAQSQSDYDDLLADLEEGSATALISAEQALTRAARTLTETRFKLDENEYMLEPADQAMYDLERRLNRARAALASAERRLAAAKDPADVAEAQARLDDAQAKYDEALEEWREGYDTYGDELGVLMESYRSAQLSYDLALEARDTAARDAQRSLEKLARALEGSRLSADNSVQKIELEKLRRDLSDSSVKAPVSGTVTAVYAKEGLPGSGLLFVIEDTDSLIVTSSLREYDVGSVTLGMPVVIKSDATGEQEFEGKVSYISPTSTKSADGSTVSGTTVEFAMEVSVDSVDTGLRVGMNARIGILTAQKDSVWSVPFDAVITNAEGKNIVYRMRTEGKKSFAEAVEVTVGLETDFYLEIDSPELAEGDLIITDPSGLTDGAEVVVVPYGIGMAG